MPLGRLLAAAERRVGSRLEGLRVLAHCPKALIGAGLLEAFVAHDDADAPRRTVPAIRMALRTPSLLE